MSTVTGTVVEFQLVNPHSSLVIAAEDENGNVVEWHGELGSPRSLNTTWGWTRDTFHAGDRDSETPVTAGAARVHYVYYRSRYGFPLNCPA